MRSALVPSSIIPRQKIKSKIDVEDSTFSNKIIFSRSLHLSQPKRQAGHPCPKMQKLTRKRVLNILFNFICCSVACINFAYLFYRYFNYPVIIRAAPYTPIDLALPKLSLCFSLSSLLANVTNVTFFHPFENILNRTVGDLKQSTPDLKNVLVGCSIRDWDVDELRANLPLNECLEYFKLSKYRMHGYMCYKFEPPEMNYTFFSILHTLDHHRMLYQVAVGPPLNAGHKVCPLIHFGEYPFHDQFYSKEYMPAFKNTTFAVSYSSYEINRMKPPYETRCRPQSEPECFVKCFHPTYAKFGIVRVNTYPGLESDSLILPDMVSEYKGKKHDDIRDPMVAPCHEHCGFEKECQLTLAVTKLTYEPNTLAKLIFSVQTIDSPSMLMKVSAMYEPMDFITQVVSLAGCWLGFSVLGLGKLRVRGEDFKNVTSQFWTGLSDLSNKSDKILFIRSQLQRTVVLNEGEPVDLFTKTSNEKRLRIISLVLSCLLMLTILILFSIQVVNVMRTYFEFATKTVISFEIDPRIPPPNVDICFYYEELIPTPFRNDLNTTNYHHILTKADEFHNYSLATLLSKSPPGDEIISACRVRDKSKGVLWLIKLHPVETCKRHFNITRYYMDRKICYHFEPYDQVVMGQVNKKWEWHMPGMYYTLILSPNLAKVTDLTYALNYEKPPEVSSEYAYSDFETTNRKMIILTSYVHEQFLLQLPYDTRCDPALRNKSCIRKCLVNETVTKLNRLPYSMSYTENFVNRNPHLHLLKYSDIKSDEKANKIWVEIEEKCERICDRTNCIKRSIKTLASYRMRSEYKVEISTDAKESPDIKAKTYERMSLFDFYYQLICCLNFWLGFSVINFNPYLLMERKRINRIKLFIARRFLKIKLALKFLRALNMYINSPLDPVQLARKLKKGEKKLTCYLRENWADFLTKILCVICCTGHLYLCLSAYLMFPTLMNIYSETSTNISDYSLTICISTVEKLSSQLKIEPEQVAQEISKFTVGQILDNSPNISDFLLDCEDRGLSHLKMLPNSGHLVENRIYFWVGNRSYCENIFETSKFLFNGHICYTFTQKYKQDLSPVQSINVLNYPKGMFSLFINSTFLTRKYTIIVGRIPKRPYYSGLWSRVVVKTDVPVWHDVSYIGYTLKTLPVPYEKNGYWEPDTVSCIDQCMMSKLAPQGKGIFGFNLKPHLRYLSLSERRNQSVQRSLKSFRKKCKHQCQLSYSNTFFDEKNSFRVTKVSRPFVSWYGAGLTGFYLRATEYPRLSVIFLPYWKLPELLINLGSILGIWFGLSAMQLNSLLRPKPSAKLDELAHLKCELNKMLRDFDLTIRGHF